MRRLFLLFFLITLWALPVKAEGLQFYTEYYPPLNYQDQRSEELMGISVDIVDEMMKRTGFNYDIKIAPWKRGYELTLSQEDTCLFTTAHTPERLDLFKWVMPLSNLPLVLFSRADNPITLTALNEASIYRIGGYLGDATVDYLVRNGISVETATNDKFNLKKLQNGRIDLWATGKMAGLSLAQDMGVSGLHTAFELTNMMAGIACNRQVNGIILDRMQLELDRLYEEGFVAQVYKKYLPGFEPPEHSSQTPSN